MKAIGIKRIKFVSLHCKIPSNFSYRLNNRSFLEHSIWKYVLNEISKNFIISMFKYVLVNFLCSVLIVGIILLFCYTSTRKVNKFTPVDVIRNGSNGDTKQGIIRLSKVKCLLCLLWLLMIF